MASLENRIVKRKQVSAFLDRVEAQLTSTANSVEEIMAEILRLQAIGANELRSNQKLIINRLRQEAGELSSYEGESAMRLDREVSPLAEL